MTKQMTARERSLLCTTKASKCHSPQAFRPFVAAKNVWVARCTFLRKCSTLLTVAGIFFFELNKMLKIKRNLMHQAKETHNKMFYSAVLIVFTPKRRNS